jgi:hypothetical protein
VQSAETVTQGQEQEYTEFRLEQEIAKVETCASSFVKGDQAWTFRKKKFINDLADIFKKWIDAGLKIWNPNTSKTVDYSNYGEQNIASLVCDKLEEYHAPPSCFSYVRRLLAKKGFTDSTIFELTAARDRALSGYEDELDAVSEVNLLKYDYIPREKFAALPIEEQIRLKREYREGAKERKFRDRENNTMMDEELQKKGVDLRLIKSGISNAPPASMWRVSKSEKKVIKIRQQIARLDDIYEDVQTMIHQFPPDDELDDRLAQYFDIFIDLLWGTLIKFWSPWSDNKNAMTYPAWVDRLFTDFFAIEDAQIVRRALPTGEFVTMDRDGKEMVIPLCRKITNKHVKEKLAQIELEQRKSPLFALLFFSMELYINENAIPLGDNQEEIAKIREAYKKIRCSTYQSFNVKEPQKEKSQEADNANDQRQDNLILNTASPSTLL